MSAPVCGACDGSGERNICPLGCNGSHVSDYTLPCHVCDGTGDLDVLPEPTAEGDPAREDQP